jgi:hypothetical protein
MGRDQKTHPIWRLAWALWFGFLIFAIVDHF